MTTCHLLHGPTMTDDPSVTRMMTGSFHMAHLMTGWHSHGPMTMAGVNHDPHNNGWGLSRPDDDGMGPSGKKVGQSGG